MTESNGAEHRHHVRCTVYEPCIAAVGSQEYSGAVVDMSVGGAAVRLEVEIEVQPAPDTPMQLQIEGIGWLHTRVVRSLLNGVAVEFKIDPRKESHLLTALQQVLSNYPIDE
ncbi:MAG: PilZ domain-containing protein [Alphaproteobacteria bacterium]